MKTEKEYRIKKKLNRFVVIKDQKIKDTMTTNKFVNTKIRGEYEKRKVTQNPRLKYQHSHTTETGQ